MRTVGQPSGGRTARAGGGGGLTGQWGSDRTWSCRGQWAGGRSSSRHQPPSPSSHLPGSPGPRCHLQGHRATTLGCSTRQAPVTQASPRQQMPSQPQPHSPGDPPRKGRVAEGTGAHTGPRLSELWLGVSGPREQDRLQRPFLAPRFPGWGTAPWLRTPLPRWEPLVEVFQEHKVPQPRDCGRWAPLPGLRAHPSRKDRAWLPLPGPGLVLDRRRCPDPGL